AARFRRLDHPQADAVLDGAAGVLRFQLEIELADTAVEMLGLDDRGVADQVEYGLGNGHAVARDPGAGWVRRTRASLRDDAWGRRSEEHTSELQSRENLVCRLLLEKK